MNRRDFLFQSATAWGKEAVAKENDILVVLFLRGGCDALNLLVPAGTAEDRKAYDLERPNINTAASSLLPLNEHFGLHPSAGGLHDLYKAKKLAVIAAAGMMSNNRSHFDAQAFMELGTPDKKNTLTGWLTRHLESTGQSLGPLNSISLGSLTPTSLLGCADSTAIVQPKRFSSLGGDKNVRSDMTGTLMEMYQASGPVFERCRSALKVIEKFGGGGVEDYVPKAGVVYPKNELGNNLRTLANLLKLNLGIQIATVDMGGWDTHKYQGQGMDGTFARQVDQLSSAVQAFYHDLETDDGKGPGKKITVVVMSEFGRRLRENANRGTDHGHGGMMMVIGSQVKGAKVYGKWPGLQTEQLYERADLAVTTDFRQVLGEILRKRRGEKNLAAVFPDYKFAKELDFII